MPSGFSEGRRPQVLHLLPWQPGCIPWAAGHGCLCAGCYSWWTQERTGGMHPDGSHGYLPKTPSDLAPPLADSDSNALAWLRPVHGNWAATTSVALPLPWQTLGGLPWGTVAGAPIQCAWHSGTSFDRISTRGIIYSICHLKAFCLQTGPNSMNYFESSVFWLYFGVAILVLAGKVYLYNRTGMYKLWYKKAWIYLFGTVYCPFSSRNVLNYPPWMFGSTRLRKGEG